MTLNIRHRHTAAIHACAAKLGLDTADKNPASEYRSMLLAVGGKTSTTDMDEAALKRVMVHLLRTLNPSDKPRPKDGWQAEKARNLWAELGQIGALKDPSDEGLRRFVEAQLGVSALRFLDTHQANRIVETLKAWLKRERSKAAV